MKLNRNEEVKELGSSRKWRFSRTLAGHETEGKTDPGAEVLNKRSHCEVSRWSSEEEEPKDRGLRRTGVSVSSSGWKLQCPPRSQQLHAFHVPSLGARRLPREEGHLRTMRWSVCGFLLRWVLLLYLLIPSYFLLVFFTFYIPVSNVKKEFCSFTFDLSHLVVKLNKNEEFPENHIDCNPHVKM